MDTTICRIPLVIYRDTDAKLRLMKAIGKFNTGDPDFLEGDPPIQFPVLDITR